MTLTKTGAKKAMEAAALAGLFALLESRYALRVLWALRDGRPQTFRLLQESVGQITPNTLNTRLKDLRAAGVVDHAAGGYGLTPLGQDLVGRLAELPAFAAKWAARIASQAPKG